MRKAVAAKIVNEVANWGHAGHVDAGLLKTLQARYGSDITARQVLLRWLGFLALFWLGSSVFGLIGFLLGPLALYLAPFILGGLAFVSWKYGVKLATDPSQHFATSGAVLVTFSFLLMFGALATAYGASGADNWRFVIPVGMCLTAVGAIITAYRFSLRWPLLIAVLLIFHAVGNKHGYMGGGGYFLAIRDEWLMLAAASVAIVLGYFHERFYETRADHRHIGFGHIYLIIGLLYANLSLWFLSIPGRELMPVLLFAAAGVVQLVVGARLHDSRFTGFGIVFLAINLYTRMFEGFWDDLSKGIFFLVAGVIALVIGALFEARAKKLRAES
ncbi:MAG: hypothetical protein WBD13_00265 [Burkholderiaceae bacterium]